MILIYSLSLFAVLVGVVINPASGTCCGFDHIKQRQDCGYFGITRDECELRGCCFDNTYTSVPWCFYGYPKSSCQVAQSNRITNWGTWGAWANCSAGSYVYGVQMKREFPQGGYDDSALNGIRLFCARPGEPRDFSRGITSKVGIYGKWGYVYACKEDYFAVGFAMRVESPQGTGDDTATNNFAIQCGIKNSTDYSNYLQGDGLTWGEWSFTTFCRIYDNDPFGRYGIGGYITGIRTQVVDQPVDDADDDTGLNNVDLRCTNV